MGDDAENGTERDHPDLMGGAERLDSRSVFRGRVVDLSVDRVRLPGGKESDLELLHFQGAAAVVPLLPAQDGGGEDVLLIRQFRYPTGGWLLEIPAGKLDAGEAPEECARRELAEETGLRGGDLEALGWIWTTPGAADEKIWLFTARGLSPGETALEHDEVLEPVRLPLEEALRRAVDGEIHDAKTVCALLRLASRNGTARTSARTPAAGS